MKLNRLALAFIVGITAFFLNASRPFILLPALELHSTIRGPAFYDSLRAILSGFRWPTESFLTITSSFADFRTTHFHGGIDISTHRHIGYRVFASRSGYIFHISVSPIGYGKLILVRHPDGYTTAYAHLSRFNDSLQAYINLLQHAQDKYPLEVTFSPDQFPVSQGDVIGYTGDTGVGNAHLHFEIHDEQFNPMNPLLVPEFSEYIKDSAPPEFRKAAFVPLDHSSLVNNSQKMLVVNATKTDSHTYHFRDIVRCTGTIGVEIYAMDRSDDTWYRSTATDLEFSIDSTLLFSSKISRIAYDETKQIALHFDWDLREKRKGYFQKLYVEPGNRQPFYSGDSSSFAGVSTDHFSEGYHSLTIVASDVFGNSAVLKGTVVFNHPPKIEISHRDTQTVLRIEQMRHLKSVAVGSFNGTSWNTRTYAAASLERNGDAALLPIIVGKNSILRVQAENIYGSKSDPSFVIPERVHPRNVSFRFRKEFVRDFMCVSLTSNTLLPSPPLVIVSSGAGRHPVELHQVGLYEYTGTYAFLPEDRGRIQIITKQDSSDTDFHILDEFFQYSATPDRGGEVQSENGDLKLEFSSGGVYRPTYFRVERTYEGYAVTPATVLLNKGATVEYTLSRSYLGKVGLFYGSEVLDWTTPGMKNVLTGKVARFVGRFSLIEDDDPPEITRVQTSYSNKKIRISFRVHDAISGIEPDSIKIRIDNQVLIGEFDPYAHVVRCEEIHPLSAGAHEITIESSDRMANKAIIRRTLIVSRSSLISSQKFR